jgi:subtilisin-like proprotein convertase family protein
MILPVCDNKYNFDESDTSHEETRREQCNKGQWDTNIADWTNGHITHFQLFHIPLYMPWITEIEQ